MKKGVSLPHPVLIQKSSHFPHMYVFLHIMDLKFDEIYFVTPLNENTK
jgi:hypothetical protein